MGTQQESIHAVRVNTEEGIWKKRGDNAIKWESGY